MIMKTTRVERPTGNPTTNPKFAFSSHPFLKSIFLSRQTSKKLTYFYRRRL